MRVSSQIQIGLLSLLVTGGISVSALAQIQTPRISPITITPTVNGNTTTTIDPRPAADAAELRNAIITQQQEIQQQQADLQQQRARQDELTRAQAAQAQEAAKQKTPPPGSAGYTVVSEDGNTSSTSTTSTTLDYSEFVSDAKNGKPELKKKKPGGPVFAIFETSKGTFKAKLFDNFAPKTVENFVGLARGTKSWMDTKSNTMVHRPFYDGLKFHRVIPQFMIQGGDPAGDGTGGPGYQFDDEIATNLHHNKAGMLSMANAGPNTNGSQFFITVAPASYLDGKYNIFGEIVEGQHVVDEISKVKRNARDVPNDPVIIKHVRIVEK